MADFLNYDVFVGTFEGEDFVWKKIKSFNEFNKAYNFYKEYAMKQMGYDDKELQKIWNSIRVDVVLRQGKKLINWAGIVSRRVDKDDEGIEDMIPKNMRKGLN